MSIKEIREFLIDEGDRRRRLGLLARRQVDDDWAPNLNAPKSSGDEPKALGDE